MQSSCEAIMQFDDTNHMKFRQVLSIHKQLDKAKYRKKTQHADRSPSASPCPSPTTEHSTITTTTTTIPHKSADHITYSQPRIVCLQLPPWEVEADEAAPDKENQVINRRTSSIHRRESVPLGSLEPIQYGRNNDSPEQQSLKLHLDNNENGVNVDDDNASPLTPKSQLMTSTPTSASSTGGYDSTNRKRFKEQIRGLANGRMLVSSLKNISTGGWKEGSGHSKRTVLKDDEDGEDSLLSSPVQRMTFSGESPSLNDLDIPDSPISSLPVSFLVKGEYSLPEIQLSETNSQSVVFQGFSELRTSKRKPDAREEDDGADRNMPKADRHVDKKIVRDFGELSLTAESIISKPASTRRRNALNEDAVMRQSTSYDKNEHTIVVTSLEDDDDDAMPPKDNPNFSILSEVERRLTKVPNLLLDRATKVLQTRHEACKRNSSALVLYRNPEVIVQSGRSNNFQAGQDQDTMDIG